MHGDTDEAADAHLALYAAAAASFAECGEGGPLAAGARDSLLHSFVSAGGRHASSTAGNGPSRNVSDLSRQQLAALVAGGASVTARVGNWELDTAMHPQQLSDAAAAAAELYARQTSGNCEQDSKANNSMRALHGAIAGAAAGIGHTTTEAHTTEDGMQQQQGAAAGDAGVGRGHHKQQVFEDARKRLGATAGDLARSDALVLEAVLGEGTFGKVFKGEQSCMVANCCAGSCLCNYV
jgi:hypothetical protein